MRNLPSTCPCLVAVVPC